MAFATRNVHTMSSVVGACGEPATAPTAKMMKPRPVLQMNV